MVRIVQDGKIVTPAPESPPSTFITALDFNFENDQAPAVVPKPELSRKDAQQLPHKERLALSETQQNPVATSRMRGAKVNAMSALKRAATDSPTSKLDHPSVKIPINPVSQSQTRRPPPKKAPKLDFDTVRLGAPADLPDRSQPRLFGLEHCPVYRPTLTQFAKPMEYIETVCTEARKSQYGICKIVPPEGWRPPFMLNTETFRFKTRLQRLNSMEASARANVNFLEQLYIFHRQHGDPKITVPTIHNKTVDLLAMRREIQQLGGIEQVKALRKWPSVARAMGYDLKRFPFIVNQLKIAYLKIVQPFEDHIANRSPSPAMTPSGNSMRSTRSSPPGMRKSPNGSSMGTVQQAASKLNEVLNSPPPATEGEASKMEVDAPLDTPQKEGDQKEESKELQPSGSVGPKKRRKKDEDKQPGENCEVCSLGKDPNKILLCDECDRGFHMYCLTPPLTSVPRGEWICTDCLANTGADYGFEEGHEHSFHSFQRRSEAFRDAWLEKHRPKPEVEIKEEPIESTSAATVTAEASGIRPGKGKSVTPPVTSTSKPATPRSAGKRSAASSKSGTPPVLSAEEKKLPGLQCNWEEEIELEDWIEREFWRLVESSHDTVEVEYGADIHTTSQGSAAPTLERDYNNPYAKDGWNLNNMPILHGSMLRYVKSDICGMTQPWGYVGMMFSTFAWHKEDHYTYSVNYMHFGHTKTWYGVPAADDKKLEAAMKTAAPELFAQQPDLMSQLVTLMSPRRLIEAGVRVNVCDQRANEFVITLPKAYHAGFNHGLNYNEAVNFCLPDWLPYGLECIKDYQSLGKNPVFSHDELLVTIQQNEKNPRASRWLLPMFREMTNRELEERTIVRTTMAGVQEKPDHSTRPSNCSHCRVFCYLSQLVIDGKPYCLAHAQELKPEGEKVFKIRVPDSELRAMLNRVKSRSDKAGRTLFSEPLLIADTTGDTRKSSRKRKATVAALDSDLPSIAQRAKQLTSTHPDFGRDDNDAAEQSLAPMDEDADFGELELSPDLPAVDAPRAAISTFDGYDWGAEINGAKLDEEASVDMMIDPALLQ